MGHDTNGGGPRLLTLLGPKDFFGEMSLIDKVFRSATTVRRLISAASAHPPANSVPKKSNAAGIVR